MEGRSMNNWLEGCQFTPPDEVAEVFHQIEGSDLAFAVCGSRERIQLWYAGAKFCPRNAATGHGRLVREGTAAFEALFADTVEGVGTYRRGPDHPAFLPTDEQAEVLIPDRIQRQDVIGIAVRDDAQARREASRLELLERKPPPIVIVPEFFDPSALSRRLRAGRIPTEREHRGGSADAR